MLSFPSSSLYFPAALRYGKHILLLQAETCDKTQNKKRNYKKITIKLWDILSLRTQIGQDWGTRHSILPRSATRHSENRAGTPIGCTMVMCANCLTSVSVPCSIIVIQACCHSPKSGISAITSVRMWADYWKPNQWNQTQTNPRTTNKTRELWNR